MTYRRTTILTALVAALTTGAAVADTITPVEAVFGPDDLDWANHDCLPGCPAGIFNPAFRMIDGSGLDGVGPELSQTHSGAHADAIRWGPDEANFKSVTQLMHIPIVMDLGGLFDLTHVHIWNFTHSDFLFFANGRDSKDVEIQLSTDGASYSTAATVSLTSSGVLTEQAQTFALIGTASHVRLYIRSWYGPPGDHEVGLSEIRFTGTPVSSDGDGDGVADADDACSDTAAGAAVDGAGCSGAQNVANAAPCDGDWRNHGDYVSTVSHAAEDQVAAGLLTEEEAEAIVSAAGQSLCGHREGTARGKGKSRAKPAGAVSSWAEIKDSVR